MSESESLEAIAAHAACSQLEKFADSDAPVPFIVQSIMYTEYAEPLNCQSEVAIFGVKKEKNPKLTLTKEYGIYRYFKIFRA